MAQITIHRGRTKTIEFVYSFDISTSTFRSQIRKGRNVSSDLIAEWDIEFTTDGTDGKLVLTLDNSITATVTENMGYMDIKRIEDGEPVDDDTEPLQVFFEGVVTE